MESPLVDGPIMQGALGEGPPYELTVVPLLTNPAKFVYVPVRGIDAFFLPIEVVCPLTLAYIILAAEDVSFKSC
jgi:hypothetical protein